MTNKCFDVSITSNLGFKFSKMYTVEIMCQKHSYAKKYAHKVGMCHKKTFNFLTHSSVGLLAYYWHAIPTSLCTLENCF